MRYGFTQNSNWALIKGRKPLKYWIAVKQPYTTGEMNIWLNNFQLAKSEWLLLKVISHR